LHMYRMYPEANRFTSNRFPAVEAGHPLQLSEKRLRSIIEQSVDGIMLTNETGGIVEWNAGMERITGYGRETAMDVPLWEMVNWLTPENEREWVGGSILQNQIRSFFETGEAAWLNRLEERTVQTSHGQRRIVQVVTFAIPTEAGTLAGSIFRDVTEKIEQDRQMQQQERMAAVGQLAAGIAHDFNNILAVILLYAETMLRSHQLPHPTVTAVKTIVDQSSRAAALIQQILDFSRRTVLEKQVVDLRPLLQNLADIWQRTLPSNINIKLDLGNSAIIQADPTRIQQVFMNLVVNARDAMPDGGELIITLGHIQNQPHTIPGLNPEIDKWVKATVADTGCGIPADVIPRLYEPFFTTKEPGKGTGLGLAQVYGIVKQHEGHIDLASEPDKGTAFALYFPALIKPELEPEEDVTNRLHLGHKQTVLLIEDDHYVREALINSLTALNYHVIPAHDGQEAISMGLRHHQDIDVILTDAVMPNLSGFGLLSQLPQELTRKPIILLSGHPLPNTLPPLSNTLPELQEMGIAGYLTKPVTLEELSHLLFQILPK